MAHFNFVISQNAKWGHAGFYIDCHRMTVPENIILQKSTVYNKTSFINETDYAELVGLCGICPIMRKVTNYAQNYARA